MPRQQLPPETRRKLLLEIYDQAEILRWEFLSNPQRTDQYRRWYEDAKVGGVLLSFVEERDARVWIKDVALKEYGRAKEGIGSYVPYVRRRFRGPEQIVRAVCGEGWHFVPDTVDVKPNQCLASDGVVTRHVCWGRSGQLRDLFWAAVNHAVDGDKRPAIVVTTQDGETLTGGERSRHLRIAEHCGIDLVHLHRAMILNPDYIG
jgi:hypothetical protein